MAATALPSSGAPDPAEKVGCDTSDMFVIHGLLRSLFADTTGLVEGVRDGDAERAEIVGAHLVEISTALHHHHVTEDANLWDQLEARDPSCSVHVTQMKAQHARVAESVSALQAALPAWRGSGTAADAGPVLIALDGILGGLREHLGDEESIILPIAARTMTQSAWNRLGEEGRASVPKDRMFIQLGFILASLPTDRREKWKKEFLPLPARLMYALVGRRQYEQHRAKVYGTAA
jgi:hypothetical protein